jgi:hypothetical protein
LALNSGAWFFLFVILDRLSHQSIHLNNWSEVPRPPLFAELNHGKSSIRTRAAVCRPAKRRASKRVHKDRKAKKLTVKNSTNNFSNCDKFTKIRRRAPMDRQSTYPQRQSNAPLHPPPA